MATTPPGNTRAPLTARVGAMRVGAFRVGFTPQDTKESPSGAFYRWEMVRGAGVESLELVARASRWTVVTS